ncbi:hypothetical protein [Rhizobium mayense]|uniref:Uncharacterized protein n=1 Tax=Rhizobium mayense TaxID=1312184 RepID=A0ABT7JVF2_9HYPH|nr:hypothetical protein [Rhizobium mayense]MDL2400326.1 hypothetical protein [Rhizobium mayense]
MSNTPSPQHEAFTLIGSEEDRQEILAFIRKNQHTLDRLLNALSSAPGRIEDGCYILARPIHLTVDADRFAMSYKKPKPKRSRSGGYCINFEIRSRDAANHAATALGFATAVGCMRIRDAIRASNLIRKTGQDASGTLNHLAGVFIAQIESASHHLSARLAMH